FPFLPLRKRQIRLCARFFVVTLDQIAKGAIYLISADARNELAGSAACCVLLVLRQPLAEPLFVLRGFKRKACRRHCKPAAPRFGRQACAKRLLHFAEADIEGIAAEGS